MCKKYCMKHENTNARSPEINSVEQKEDGIIQTPDSSGCKLPSYPHVELTPSETLGAEAVHWAFEAVNHTATS